MNQLRKIIVQFSKFGVVGVIATVIDFAVLYLLTDGLGIHYLLSAGISFVVSTLFNYWASMRYVFKSRYGDSQKTKELGIFLILSIIGLALNELFMWLFVNKYHLHYLLAKVAATVLVMVWNFVSRKVFIEEHK